MRVDVVAYMVSRNNNKHSDLVTETSNVLLCSKAAYGVKFHESCRNCSWQSWHFCLVGQITFLGRTLCHLPACKVCNEKNGNFACLINLLWELVLLMLLETDSKDSTSIALLFDVRRGVDGSMTADQSFLSEKFGDCC